MIRNRIPHPVPTLILSFQYFISDQAGASIMVYDHWYKPTHVETILITYANSEGSDEPAHPRILARAFAVRSHYTEKLEQASDKELEIWLHWIAAHARWKERTMVRSLFSCRLNYCLSTYLFVFVFCSLYLSHVMRKPVFFGVRQGKT